MLNVLVTGAAGFAGSNIIKFLLNKGHGVTGVYRRRIPDAIQGCRYVQQDLSESIHLSGRFDAIVHTACAHPSAGNTFQLLKRENIDSMERLLEYARRHHIRTLINLSTKSIYGTKVGGVIREESDIVNPDLYGLSKYAAECLLREASDIRGLSLRLPGLAGKGAHDTWLVRTVEQIKAGETLQVSDIITKNFVWITDLAAFVEKMMIREENFPYPAVNLACMTGSSNVEIVNEIRRRTNSSSHIDVQSVHHGQSESPGNLDASKAASMGYCSPNPLRIVQRYLSCLGFSNG